MKIKISDGDFATASGGEGSASIGLQLRGEISIILSRDLV